MPTSPEREPPRQIDGCGALMDTTPSRREADGGTGLHSPYVQGRAAAVSITQTEVPHDRGLICARNASLVPGAVARQATLCG
jgi:hypothetical protein